MPTVEQLWGKLDEECLAPCEVLTISHNSNQSRGARFAGLDSAGAPLTREQAAYRNAHEPLVEIMQFKGDSECRTGLGTEDEFCNFEKYDLRPLCSDPIPRARRMLPCRARRRLGCTAPNHPQGCSLRLQVIKGWLENGAPRERVYDVACSDGLTPDPDSNRCGPAKQPLPRQRRRRQPGGLHCHPQPRRNAIAGNMGRPRFRCRGACFLLPAGAGKSALPLEHLRCLAPGTRAPTGNGADHTGARLVVTHLVHGNFLRR